MKNKILFALIFIGAAAFTPLHASGKKDKATSIEGASLEQIVSTPKINTSSSQQATVPSSGIAYEQQLPDLEKNGTAFHEVWAYLIAGREGDFDPSMPITDLCFFSADINSYGELSSIPDPGKVKNYNGRTHLVITCEGRSLTHFVLDPQYTVRKKLIAEIVSASKKFDGIQIDFETIPARDAANFLTFLGDVRNAIGSAKWFSVAVPARTREISDDIFNYKKVAPLTDRMIIMAYDEHWSGSSPGSIASLDWCEKVARYASSVIPEKKLVMGLPFYGRTWQSPSNASAWYYSGINRIMNENNVHSVSRENSVPYFSFETTVTVTGYFEDTTSLVERCKLYQGLKVRKIAFWRLGQEDQTFWPYLTLD